MQLESLVEGLEQALLAWGPNLVAALAILVLGWFASRIFASAARRALKRANVDEMLVRFLGSLIYVSAMLLVTIAALGRLGVNTTSFAAVLAAAGLAVGLAFQGTLSNFAAGVLVIVFRPFKVGDYVEAGGVSGTVEEVQIFTTVLKTPDNRRVIVGNADVTGGSITNYSANPTRRVDLVFGIGYTDDLRKAKQVLERILAEDERVLKDPAPVVAVLELGESSVNFAVRPWVKSADYWSVYFDVTERVKQTFDAEGISIPFPQRDVHLHSVQSAA
jgi:small conductance mechanosensitive channel